MTYDESGIVDAIERHSGRELAELTQVQRDGFDQFHAGGAQAVDRVIASLGVEAGMTVLDVGSGFGGPARQVARTTGARVWGVDVTETYVQAAQSITRAAQLDDQVTFECVDIANLHQHDFDAGYTMHVQMNVADKPAFFAEIAQHLHPGARFATFEVCHADDRELSLPLPWSLDGSDSFLATGDELRSDIQSGGFRTVEWADETRWILDWFENMAARIAEGVAAATLLDVLDDGPLRMLNFAAGLADGTFAIYRGEFIRD